MADYSRYKTATLQAMQIKAWEKYKAETEKSAGGWGDGYRLSKLPTLAAWEKAKNRYDEITAELKKRDDR